MCQTTDMRDDLCIYVSPASWTQLVRLVSGRNTSRKVEWRAKIVLAEPEGADHPVITNKNLGKQSRR
jgi:hypothetical protein